MVNRDEYYLQHPKQQLFYKVIAILTNFFGMGKQTWWDYDPPSARMKKVYILQYIITHTAGPLTVLSQLWFFYSNYNDLTSETKGIMLVMIPVTTLTNIVICSAMQYCNKIVMKEFMRKYHVCIIKNPDKEIKKLQIKSEITTRLVCYFMIFFLMTDWFSWSFITIYNNYKRRDEIKNKTLIYQTILYCVWPIDYRYDFKNWLIVHITNIYVVLAGCVIILLHNCMNYAFVIQLIGHIRILKYKLRTYFLGELTDGKVKEKLIDVIKYHSFVLRDIQSAFGLNVTLNYLYNLLSDSLLLYQLMVGEKSNNMMYGLMIGAYLGGLIVLSFVLEEIGRQSDGISYLVYSIRWEDMSIPNRKMLCLLLFKIQQPLTFTSSGGLKCGVKPMISILQSTFSYYVMLKSRVDL